VAGKVFFTTKATKEHKGRARTFGTSGEEKLEEIASSAYGLLATTVLKVKARKES